MMKKAFLITLALLLTVGATAGKKLEVKDLTSSKFAATSIGSVRPLADGETYARMGEGSKRIEVCSFKTGKQIGVLLDVSDVKGEKLDRVDGYMVSPDGRYVLVQTNTQRIYRHSFTATYYIYRVSDQLPIISTGFPTINLHRCRRLATSRHRCSRLIVSASLSFATTTSSWSAISMPLKNSR